MKILACKKVHMIGIKGQGMTALAQVLHKNGARITGSDTEEIFTTDPVLKSLGIQIWERFDPDHIPHDTELIIYSTAYTPDTNPELRGALTSRIPTISYSEALGLLSSHRLTLAVCGTHGKTTTTALLGEVLRYCALDPTVIVGGQVPIWGGGNVLVGKGPHLVLEADEYQNKFEQYTPWGVILTSIDWDHPDYFSNIEEYEAVFAAFIAKIPRHGFLIACGDSAAVRRVAMKAQAKTVFYGSHPDNDYRITHFSPLLPDTEVGKAGFFQSFTIVNKDDSIVGSLRLRLAGEHNAKNATAVVATATHLKLPLSKVVAALEQFSGTKRRFEWIGERRGVLIYDDFAHHPDEIRATLRAVRGLYPNRRLLVVFHPHTFTRTQALFEEFAQSFEDAQRVYLLDIYGSAREQRGGVSSQTLVEEINHFTPKKAEYAEDRNLLIESLRQSSQPGDIIITLGAGDVWQVAHALAQP